MPLTDDEAAASALSTLTNLSAEQTAAKDSIDALLSSGDEDSFVDVHELIKLYNVLYFRSQLLPRVELIWSERLTLCAGICELSRDAATRKWTRIRLKLSEPLLKLRPRSDLVNTLLHEAIHAYFFITSSFAHVRDPTGGHGSGFQALAAGINAHGGYEITEFHEFHDEVDSYRTHIWRCDGPCQKQPPYFGLVKRSMNRPPSKTDPWWTQHTDECGGTYSKIGEPEMTRKQVDKLSGMQRAGLQKNKIDAWVKKDVVIREASDRQDGGSPEQDQGPPSQSLKRARSPETVDDIGRKVILVACPICDKSVKEIYINEHLDAEHPP